ncbi:receptor-like protein 33 isoform X2 [Arachis hypogaea]|uniref:receptor-like protein 33 isoform X2 n=1 Tax=Arachis hypogaea TaxID=3818 RepID=UPI003B21D29C
MSDIPIPFSSKTYIHKISKSLNKKSMGYLMLLVVRVVLCVHMFMMFHFACLSSHLCHSQDSSALLHFKTHFIFNTSFFEYSDDDDYDYEYECPHVYPKMSTWENGTDCCSWMGVTCHSVSGHVIGLDLSYGALVDNWSGIVHFPLFSELQNLEYLFLSGCTSLLLKSETSVNHTFSNLRALQLLSSNITGWSEFSGKFPNLEDLELYNNSLQEKVPKWIHGIDSLRYLNLSHNNFTLMDHFPWYPLEILDLSFNSMADDISSFFCNATSLYIVNLSHNKFTGTFPQCLANTSSLGDLDLQMNKLHGTLPDTFLDLNTLNLNGNNFEGLLPKSLSKCSGLVDLDLGNNQFEDTFPNWLQNLSNLEILVLRGNKLYGQIVNLKCEKIFASLIIFDISCNNFSGSLPKAYIQNFRAMKIVHDVQSPLSYIEQYEFGIGDKNEAYDSSMVATIKRVSLTFTKIPNTFAIIDLSENKFEGEIPDVIGELHRLKSLNLSYNNLIGPIPPSLGNLTNLESLDLSSNMLDGNIPAELTNLNFLESLNLSNNHLEGSIPQGKQFDTFSNDSYQGNMGLCGFPLSIQCNNVPLQQCPSSEAEDKFGFGWKPVAIGYACGMVLGIGLGYCVFSIGKPQWLVVLFGGKRTKRRSRGNRRRARTTLFQLFLVM